MHQAVGKQVVTTQAIILPQAFQERLVIRLVMEDPLFVAAAQHDMIDAGIASLARSAGHGVHPHFFSI